jgi:NAD(P)H-hydrate repair Nnr-like enzyme with NAD(P)H-hydrate dehydratase domain
MNAVVALKGPETIISDSGGNLFLYRGGGVGLATSGSGDVLAGIVTGFLARGASPVQAAVWGVFMHGEAGKALAKKFARVGFLAREIMDEVPVLLDSI